MAQYFGGPDDDFIWTKPGKPFDFVKPGKGDDTVWLNNSGRVHLGAGDDRVIVAAGKQADLFGGEGNDTFNLRKAGASTVWAGTDPGIGHDASKSNPWDVDTIRLNPNARGQIIQAETSLSTETIVITGAQLEMHHIVVEGTIFDLDVEAMRFAKDSRGDIYLAYAQLDSGKSPELQIHFAKPNPHNPAGNPTWDEMPDWQRDPSFDPGYKASFWGPNIWDAFVV